MVIQCMKANFVLKYSKYKTTGKDENDNTSFSYRAKYTQKCYINQF